jgi:aldose 1-epimerase
MPINARSYGITPDGQEVVLYTLTNANGLKAEIINYGGIITSLMVPDRDGNLADIVLGYDSLKDYLVNPTFFGAIIGRYANRLEEGRFTLNHVDYQLSRNDGNNHLHGGQGGFHKRVWDARILTDGDDQRLELSRFSTDGEENYPGNLEVRVIYALTDDNTLDIKYYAVSDKDTIVNLTNHAYFNLGGHASGTILNHELMIHADFYTPISKETVPTGEILSVKDTPFDFTKFRRIGEGLTQYADHPQMKNGSGYDHNFVLKVSGSEPEEIAQVYDPQSGRLMRVLTTKPGVQFYSGNFLKTAGAGKEGKVYDKWDGFCLETQYFPNGMKYPHFPSPILRAGQTYHHITQYQFGIR